LIAHERRLLADCEDATERVRLRADKKTRLRVGVLKVTLGETLPVSSAVNVRVSCAPPGIRQRVIFWRRHNAPTVVSLVCIESFSVVDVDDAAAVQVQRAHSAHGRKQRVDCKGHQRPQKRFPNLASFRPVEAESEIVFSKKVESFQ
jgi:hypothetical protein